MQDKDDRRDGGGVGDSSSGDFRPDSTSASMLPVFLERRQLPPAAPTAVSLPGKGKKGKKQAGKGAVPEQPPSPLETPWRCRAVIDLSPLIKPVIAGGGKGSERKRSSVLPEGPATGDSPLRAELRAKLALVPLTGDAVVSPPGMEEPGAAGVAEGTESAAVRTGWRCVWRGREAGAEKGPL